MDLKKLFAPGNRKNIAFMIGILLTLFGDKLGVTMTDDIQQSVITLITIFTGGNVLSKFAYVFGQKKLVDDLDVRFPALSDKQVDAESQEDFTLGEVIRVEKYAQQIAKDATAELNKVHTRCKTIETHMAKQSQSINDLIAMMQPKSPSPGKVPTPNELYQG